MNSMQYWAIIGLLAGAAAMVQVRGDSDRVPSSEPLAEFPETIGPLVGTDFPLDDETLEVLGKGVFMDRLYKPAAVPGQATSANATAISLFIAYFPTQRSGQSIHSPQHCLPGAGWSFESSGTTDLTDSTGKTITVGDYVISDGTSRSEVLYWYRSHGRNIASDYTAKFYTLWDSMRLNRTDAALIRIVVPMRSADDRAEAHNRAVWFAEQITPLLPPFIPD
jgi:EpsI family protein